MKKALLILSIVFSVMTIHAQVSVWDGTAEPWTQGSGTQNDPYLIENAQQLAYLAVVTNELHYSNYEYHNMYVDTCFLLTIDLDLGGNDGLVWEPVAQDGNSLQTRCFGGNFDGGNHTVTNMKLMDDPDREYMGLFGHVMDGSIKNLTIVGDNIAIPEFNLSGMPGGVGMIVGYGENVSLMNCVNLIDVTWENVMFEMGGSIGGLFGRLINSTITNCHNLGDINAPEANSYYSGVSIGGIAGSLLNCVVVSCSSRNYANITMDNGNDNFGEVLCGGIAGRMSGSITNSFNIGDFNIVVDLEHVVGVRAAGGLVGAGFQGNTLLVTNSYSVASISVSGNYEPSYMGGIVGYADETMHIEVDNSYYLNVLDSNNSYGIPKIDDELKSQEFVDLLNSGGGTFIIDQTGYYNYGYPMLDWYYDHFNSVDENITNNAIAIYPNPATSVINISFAENASCTYVEIYSIDGKMVKALYSSFGSIDVSELSVGMYLVKVRMSDGTEYSKRIIK